MIKRDKKNIYKGIIIAINILIICITHDGYAQEHNITDIVIGTYCNPVDISYRFSLDSPSRREAADPSVIQFKGQYYLFASKSGGYWRSSDLLKWKFVEVKNFPTEDYAPTAVVINDSIYMMASSDKIYQAKDIDKGTWKMIATLPFGVIDPAFFMDDDDKLYLYWGCSDVDPLYGVQLDYHQNKFNLIGEPKPLIYTNPNTNGWEVSGDTNETDDKAPWLEGAWMNKHHDIYYLQYASPGTQYKSYSDGVYYSENPLGPFVQAENNPFSYKPSGYANGAGHGSTFKDKYGNFWHIATVTVSNKHMFERRLSLFPAFFDQEGVLFAQTGFGDYPMQIPKGKVMGKDYVLPFWMLLSYDKPVQVSSEKESFVKTNLADENLRTFWSAKSGNPNEWAEIDLQNNQDVYAVQLNFYENNSVIYGRQKGLCYQYTLEGSLDRKNWKIIADKSSSTIDNPHQYIQLKEKERLRYIRINNIKVPSGNFALSGFRVFGKGLGKEPKPVEQFIVDRQWDRRRTRLKWKNNKKAIGYIIYYGNSPNKLYHSYLLYKKNSFYLNSLNANQPYVFQIYAFNENGFSEASKMVLIK
ncbi:family 43 glycosylhydrolase [Galbibacter pacificus]|uniref:Family 43 glycosylhydrolase n=1 Tax=Galbibacter pacificus TaxID=2996052 RepID=A0ABT6FMQ4_9FLAO|nr:family 43 glycosylhydrolase [Galbibacter pacificus]MDG3581058.1 family 43 glycosylhydrolase [Galbibacter pacificus]MDG3584536.1 family 43 glycosylhydrolase [Galbibacter pacificus]